MTQMVCVRFHRGRDTRVKSGLAGWRGPWRLVAGCFHQLSSRVTESLLFVRAYQTLGDEGERDPLLRHASWHSFPKDRACGLTSA